MRLLAVDLALRRSGCVMVPSDLTVSGSIDWPRVVPFTLDFTELKGEHAVVRRKAVVDGVLQAVRDLHVDVVAVEESYVTRNASAATLAKLHGLLEQRCHEERLELLKVTRSAGYKLLTGKGNAPKELLKLVMQRMGAPWFDDADLCDAFAAGNAALCELGHRFVGVAA